MATHRASEERGGDARAVPSQARLRVVKMPEAYLRQRHLRVRHTSVRHLRRWIHARIYMHEYVDTYAYARAAYEHPSLAPMDTCTNT